MNMRRNIITILTRNIISGGGERDTHNEVKLFGMVNVYKYIVPRNDKIHTNMPNKLKNNYK